MINKSTKKIKNLLKNRKRYKYADFYKKLDIIKDTVLFEASQGRNVEGHIFYLMKEMIDLYPYKKIYVSAREPEETKVFLAANGLSMVEVILFDSVEYSRCLATAELLINDTSFYPFFSKKQGQKYIIIWHGTPLKFMGKDVPDITSIANVQRNFFQADQIHVSNEYTREIFLRAYNLEKIYKGEVIVAPSPRNSALCIEKDKKEAKKKRILYMPTWRGTVGKVKNDEKIFSDLQFIASSLSDDTEFYVQLHPLQATKNIIEIENIHEIPSEIELYTFLQTIDILITDYSSIMYDFLNMHKPIILYTHDKEAYLEERGIYEDFTSYPFVNVDNVDDLITECLSAPNEIEYPILEKRFCSNDSQNGATVVVKYIVDEEKSAVIDSFIPYNGKETVVIFCGGFWNNGITSSLLNFLDNIDKEEKNYVCIFNKSAVKPSSYNRVRNLQESVQIFPMTGAINGNFFERLVLKKFLWNESFSYNWASKIVGQMYEKDFQRLFGCLQVDTYIHYTGFERKSINQMLNGDCRKIIFVHTDMFEHYETRKDFNRRINFGAYHQVDKVVLVSSELQDKLITNIPGIENKTMVLNNFLGENRVREKAKEELFKTLVPEKIDYIYGGLPDEHNLIFSEMLLSFTSCFDKAKHIYKDDIENYNIVVELQKSTREYFVETINMYKSLLSFERNKSVDILDTFILDANKIISNYKTPSDFDGLFIIQKDVKALHDSVEGKVIKKFNTLFYKESELPTERLTSYLDIILNDRLYFKNSFLIEKMKIIETLLNPANFIFINIGRYEEQKGHDKLIYAFEKIYAQNSNAFLFLVCPYGSLKEQIITQSKESIASKNIIIIGGMENPYAVLKNSSAFVLSSNFEGLGLVLYEALALDIDVVTVDLPQTIQHLDGANAIIVENSISGLAKGMEQQLSRGTNNVRFDFQSYNHKNLTEFEKIF